LSNPLDSGIQSERVVVDTGVVLSRIIRPDSTPARAFEAALLSGPLLVSAATLQELKTVLLRPKFDSYVSIGLRMKFFDDFQGL
jgi:predicted nucleic acid-binding protein